jgi:hypothetical protein
MGRFHSVWLTMRPPVDEVLVRQEVIEDHGVSKNGQIVPHFLLVCGDSSQPLGVVVVEAPSMLQAHTNAVARGLAGGLTFGEIHELSAKMATTIPLEQTDRMLSGKEAARMIVRLVEPRGRPEEMSGRFPRPWRVVEQAASFTVQDARGQSVAWFHFMNDPAVAQSTAAMFKDEARRGAMNFAGPLFGKAERG